MTRYTRIDPGTGRVHPLRDEDWPDNGAREMAWTDRRGVVIADKGDWTAGAIGSPDVIRIKRGAQRGTDNQRPLGRHKTRDYYITLRAGVQNARRLKHSGA